MHFTFLDGAYAYDCIRCTTKCCNGLGFALPHEALIPFLRRAPRLAPFLQLQGRGAHVFDLSDGCWLLDAEGRCGLEMAHGRDAKPTVCRLFPLQLKRMGAELVVDLQLLQCPLEDARGKVEGPGVSVVRWEEAAREVEAAGDAFVREAPWPPGAPENFLSREAEIRDRAGALLDGELVELVAGAHATPAEPLAGLLASWREFLQISDDDWARAAATLTRPFGLALPSLRFAELQVGGAPYPRLIGILPKKLLAGAFLTALSVHAGKPAGARAIADLWRYGPSLREGLARWTETRTLMDSPAPAGAPPALKDALEQVRAHSGPIGAALSSTDLEPALRPVLLRLVADRLQ